MTTLDAAHKCAIHALLRAGVVAVLAAVMPAALAFAFDAVTLDNRTFVNKGLVGVGRIAAGLRDKHGETFGSGSGLAIDPKAWMRAADGYRGTLYILPDRGYNVIGTTDYNARLNVLSVVLKPADDPAAMSVEARQHSLDATLADTIMLTDAAGRPLTGLDPDAIRPAAGNLPDLPQAPTGAVSIDTEAVVRMDDGTFFISDEYGPYIYRFSATGRMLSAIRPPEAFIPRRNGREDFSSNNPAPGTAPPNPPDPEFGRANNQGFEGLSLTPDGRFLVAILQSATRQDSGGTPQTRRNTRMLYYDIADAAHPRLAREHVVPLPTFTSADGKPLLAAQSELLALDENRFLLLCRDGGNGYGTKRATSGYRRIELLDTSKATNIAGSAYDGTVPVAPDGKLAQGIMPATLASFIDINDNAQLGKFGLHNGPPNDHNNLSEKWEGMALAPVLDPLAAGRIPGRCFLQGRKRRRGGYHDPGLPADAAGLSLAFGGGRGRYRGLSAVRRTGRLKSPPRRSVPADCLAPSQRGQQGDIFRRPHVLLNVTHENAPPKDRQGYPRQEAPACTPECGCGWE